MHITERVALARAQLLWLHEPVMGWSAGSSAYAPVIWSGVMVLAERVYRHEHGESRLRLPDTLVVGRARYA